MDTNTTCPICHEAYYGKYLDRCACRRARDRKRANKFTADHPGYYSKYGTADCYEHMCPVCGMTFRNHKDKPCHCSVACWQVGQAEKQAEKQRQKRLPILHPGPYSLLPMTHPAMQKPRRFIANVCTVCGVGFITAYVRHATCGSDVCVAEKRRAEQHNRRVIDRAFTSGRQPGCFSVNEWGRRLIEYGRCCAYCGGEVELEIEHVFPSCRGGSNLIANIVPACRDCNQDKGVMTPDEWRFNGSKRAADLDASTWPTGKWGPGEPLSLEDISLKCGWSRPQPLTV